MKDEINRIISETASSLGMMIYDSSVLLRGENTRIAVKIDKLGIISHDDCEAFSREFAQRLDSAELVPNYSLEVSSPGIKRKLRNRDELGRFVNAPVKIIAVIDGNKTVFKGLLSSVDGDSVNLSVEGKEVIIEYESITQANLDY